MFKFEKILGPIIILGLIMKLYHIIGGNTIIILGFGILAIFYNFFSFALFNGIKFRDIFKNKSYGALSTMRIIGAVLTGFTLSVTSLGILFKLMFYPVAKLMLFESLISIIIILILLIVKLIMTKASYYRNILKRILILGSIAMILYFVSNHKLIEINYRNYPRYIKAWETWAKDDCNEQLKYNLKVERDRITMSPAEFNYVYAKDSLVIKEK